MTGCPGFSERILSKSGQKRGNQALDERIPPNHVPIVNSLDFTNLKMRRPDSPSKSNLFVSPEVAELDDYRWLVGPDAAPLLAEAARHLQAADGRGEALISLNEALRKTLSPERARLIVEQTTLRRRARKKFARAERMFFTSLGLEQATDEVIARYKANRYPASATATDICCGVGGDLLALAGRGGVRGVDCSPIAALLAAANLEAVDSSSDGAEIFCESLQSLHMEASQPWHIDPDRRSRGGRTIRVEDHQPGRSEIETLLRAAPNGAVKLAPAATPPAAWQAEAELEWISRNGECKQLVAWFGNLARQPGSRAATIVRGHVGSAEVRLRSISAPSGDEDCLPEVAREIGRYLYEPDAAVLAAEIVAALGHELGLAAVSHQSVYLTGDKHVDDLSVAGFEVLDVLSFRKKRVKQWLQQRRCGRLEVKKRGVRLDANQLQRELAVEGDEEATLLVTQSGKRVIAILAKRMDHQELNHDDEC